MKKALISVILCLLSASLSAEGTKDTIIVNGRAINARIEPLTQAEKNQAANMAKTRQGWRAMPAPIIGYNSDLGFNFGALAEIQDYGKNPSIYPEYRHRICVAASYFTKGQIYTHAEYDSRYLIPGIHFISSLTYQFDPLYSFYGLNGSASAYHPELDRRDGMAWHSYKRNMVRFLNCFQGRIVSNLQWLAGAGYFYYKTEKENFKEYDQSPTLYDEYVKYGIIPQNETQGNIIEFMGGLGWDSRDNEFNPTRGICAEVYLNGSPDLFNSGNAYLRLSAHFRHYVTPGPDWLTIAMHGAFQGCIAGKTPFYMLQHINDARSLQGCADGLGGISTLRGVMAARLLGESYAWGNFELRFRIFKWDVAGQTWFLALNPLFDLGAIVKPYNLEKMADVYCKDYDTMFRDATQLHMSAGGGIRLGMGDRHMISFECAKSFNGNDGPVSLALLVNYSF